MSFHQGSIAYARFRVVGPAPRQPSAELCEALAAGALKPPSVGAPPPVQAGWCAGRHVLDDAFEPERLCYGPQVLFGMRLDTCRVPAELRRAYQAIAEASIGTNGALGRPERAAARQEAEERCRQELADGRHRSSRLVPVLWDLGRALVLAPAFSDQKVTMLSDLFDESFGCSLQPLGAGSAAYELLGRRGLGRAYDDARPTSFTGPPPSAEEAEGPPPVPWSGDGAAPKDFLGNELLLWLAWRSERDGGVLDIGDDGVALVIDQLLEMECAWQAAGRMSLRADGPARLPEARRGLQNGKWPRKAGLILARQGEQWRLVLQGDRMCATGVQLPRPEEPPRDRRAEVERRLASLTLLDETLVGLYERFLSDRFDGAWESRRQSISGWIAGRRPDRAAPPMVETVRTNGAAAAALPA